MNTIRFFFALERHRLEINNSRSFFMGMEQRMYEGKALAADILGIPKDVALKEPVITITGRRNVYLENYNRIVSFTEQEIRIQGKTCRISVTGKRLQIVYYTRDDMLITGQIVAVTMEG